MSSQSQLGPHKDTSTRVRTRLCLQTSAKDYCMLTHKQHTLQCTYACLQRCTHKHLHTPTSPPHNHISFHSLPSKSIFLLDSGALISSSTVIVLSCAAIQSLSDRFFFIRGKKKKNQLAAICQACWPNVINCVNQMRGGMDRCGILKRGILRQSGVCLCVWDREACLCIYCMSDRPSVSVCLSVCG